MLNKDQKLQPYLVHAIPNKTNSMLCMPMQYIIKQKRDRPTQYQNMWMYTYASKEIILIQPLGINRIRHQIGSAAHIFVPVLEIQ